MSARAPRPAPRARPGRLSAVLRPSAPSVLSVVYNVNACVLGRGCLIPICTVALVWLQCCCQPTAPAGNLTSGVEGGWNERRGAQQGRPLQGPERCFRERQPPRLPPARAQRARPWGRRGSPAEGPSPSTRGRPPRPPGGAPDRTSHRTGAHCRPQTRRPPTAAPPAGRSGPPVRRPRPAGLRFAFAIAEEMGRRGAIH